MKKAIITGMTFCLVFLQAGAQPVDEKKQSKNEDVEILIDGNKLIIEAEDLEGLSTVDLNTLVREVTARARTIQMQQKELLAQVDKQLANGEISEEQADEMREMINERTEESMEMIGQLMEAWGESYEAKMEAWEEKYEAEMEAWEAEVEARSKNKKEGEAFVMPPLPPLPPLPPQGNSAEKGQRIIINDEGIIIRKGENGEEPFALRFKDDEDADTIVELHTEKKHKIDRTNGYLAINWGFNQQLRGGQEFISTGPEELDFWRSHEFNLGFGGKTRIGSPYSKFYILYGGQFSWHRFRLLSNNTLQQGMDTVFIAMDPDGTRSIDKSSYHIAYFNVPFMLELDFSKVGKIDESFTMGVGGYAGVRLGAKRKLEYNSPTFDGAEEKVRDEFYTEQFRYGVMAQVGFNSFKITAKYDLNNFFKQDVGPDYQMASITLGFIL